MCKRLSFLLITILLSFPCKPGQNKQCFCTSIIFDIIIESNQSGFNAQDRCGNMEIWKRSLSVIYLA